MKELPEGVLDLLFLQARTHRLWLDKPVEEQLLIAAYDIAKMGPTSANCSPMRILFVASDEAKERLMPHLDEGNVEKTMTAPVTAIICDDLEFYEHMDKLYPHIDAKSWFEGKEDYTKETAFRNSTLQAAYFILALRSLGLDCGPMSGFDNEAIDAEFLDGTTYKSNFLINIGYGDETAVHPRLPRFTFEDVCNVL